MSVTHRFLKNIRLLHLYLGVFTAPALIFFAFTGLMQTFSLHETTRGSSYEPPAWLAAIALLHKKQILAVPPHRPRPMDGNPAPRPDAMLSGRPGTPASAGAGAPPPPVKMANPLPMKIFFALVALSLFLSTLTGLYMAYRFSKHKNRITLVWAAGLVVPLLLLMF